MTPEATSRAIAFDPGASPLPEELMPPRAPGSRVIALLVRSEVRSDGWAERAARALARGWAAHDRDVVLVDGDFGSPTLHAVLGLPHGEGLADTLVFGASAARVVTEAPGEGFRFVPAGTVMAEPEAGWSSSRWGAFLEGFRTSGTSVFLFLPAEGEGAARLAEHADRVLELGKGGRDSELLVPGSRLLYPARESAAEGEGEGDGTEEPPPGLTGPAQDTIARKPEAEAERGPAEAGKRPPLMVSGGRASPRRVKRRVAPWVLLLLFLLVALAVAAWQGLIPGVRLSDAWFGLPDLPGLRS